MKIKFSFTSFTLLLILLSMNASAQTPHIDFTYDATGNRTQRQYFASKTMGDTSPSDSVAEETAALYGITVHPNPLMDGNSATVTILSGAEGSSGAKTKEQPVIYVLDNTGKVLFSQKPSASTAEIDLSKYSAGIYYIKVTIEKEQLFYKILKTK